MKKYLLIVFAMALMISTGKAYASLGWGTLSNFDTVNDTGVPAHGFEIEIDGSHARDVLYTYDWNHYGTPSISEDVFDPLNPTAKVRWASKKNPDGSWASYTAVPTTNISPTNGHMFTNPSVNFGGEHFGVCFYGATTAVRYFWLVDDGAGNLVHGGQVDIGTPTFVYYPPVFDPVAQVVVPAQVNAVLEQPEPAEPPVLEFGEATWVRITRTKSHNHHKVELRDLASEDPDNPNRKNWKNGEQDEIEIRWRILQTDHALADGGALDKIENAPQDLPDGDENVTLRYDLFKYVGPLDFDSGQARATDVGPDDLHGIGERRINGAKVDLSQVVVVGDYIGAQMAGFDPAQQLGLIEHVQDGEAGVAYVERTMVVGGTPPIQTTLEGDLPEGMAFNTVTGILSGTPAAAGLYTFTLHSTDDAGGDVTASYNLAIADAGDVLPAHYTVHTSAALAAAGSTAGDGEFVMDDQATVVATANAGYEFVNWTEAGAEVSTSATYTFDVKVNRDLVANFVEKIVTYTVSATSSDALAGTVTGAGTVNSGANVSLNAMANPNYAFVNWTEAGVEVSTSPTYTFTASSDRALVANFVRITFSVSTGVAPALSGTVAGGGVVNSGDNVTVVATPAVGFVFSNWTEGGVAVSSLASYTFVASANRSLTANFAVAPSKYTVSLSASPSVGGKVAGGGSVNAGRSTTVTATANAGYTFANWTENGVVVSTSSSYTFTVNANRTLVANFTATVVNNTATLKVIKISSSINGGTSVTATVSLASAAPAGGVVVQLSSSLPGVLGVPASVTVAAGKTDGNFTATASKVNASTDVTVTATSGASRITTTTRVR